MELLTSKAQSKKLDEQAESHHLSAEELMETAGSKASQWLLDRFPAPHTFIIFCGPGHNGGDGWVTASHLKKAGRQVEVFSCESSNPLLLKKKKKTQSLNVKTQSFNQWKVQKGQILVDALFGVGLTRPLEKEFRELVLKINKSRLPVIALDVPSGLCANTGCSLQPAVLADHTLSFALAKPGFYLNEGPGYSGEIIVLPIGFPKDLLNKVCNNIFLVEKKDLSALFPSYKDTDNKTHRGWTLIAAGRPGMWGCGLLASRAAYTVGSGYVTWIATQYPYEKSMEIPEALLGRLSDSALFDKKTSVGAGPGMGFSKDVENFIFQLTQMDLPVVLDADAITFLAEKENLLLNKNFLLTPHSGELSRLIKIPSQRIEEDRLFHAKQGAKKHNCWLLLKGFYPVLSDGEKSWILPFGNSALGKAGSGDVLTGIISGLMAQGLSVFHSTLLGVGLHGQTAKRWIEKGKDRNSFSASEILKELPFVMQEINEQ